MHTRASSHLYCERLRHGCCTWAEGRYEQPTVSQQIHTIPSRYTLADHRYQRVLHIQNGCSDVYPAPFIINCTCMVARWPADCTCGYQWVGVCVLTKVHGLVAAGTLLWLWCCWSRSWPSHLLHGDWTVCEHWVSPRVVYVCTVCVWVVVRDAS